MTSDLFFTQYKADWQLLSTQYALKEQIFPS